MAMRLFAERGYAATSVGDIQEAAGMTAGSGALYKHFPSKQALLQAGVRRFIGHGAVAATQLPDPEGAVEPALREIGAAVLQALAEDEAAMRVAWRDLPAFPDLSRDFVEARLQFGFAQLADWLSHVGESGGAEVEDPEATAAVLLGAPAFFRVMQAMLGEAPGHVSDERFLEAWVRLASRALAPAGVPIRSGTDGRSRSGSRRRGRGA